MPSKIRQQIAIGAARLIFEQPVLRHSDARRAIIEQVFPLGINPQDLPNDLEVAEQLRALHKEEYQSDWKWRFVTYVDLLQPLADVRQDPYTHPEGDALYHSLQVFTLAEHEVPYDEELLTAALLHDVGKAIDRQDVLNAGLDALTGVITERTSWFIEHLPAAHSLSAGTLGSRARRRLEASPDSDALYLLAECDRNGRMCGARVPELEEAVAHLHEMSILNDGGSEDEFFQ